MVPTIAEVVVPCLALSGLTRAAPSPVLGCQLWEIPKIPGKGSALQ